MTTQFLKPKKKRTRSKRNPFSTRGADIVINGDVHIPPWVTDHESFRSWAFSDDFPERGRFAFLAGKLWVDLSMETLIHNQIKAIFSAVVGFFVFNETLGRWLGDRMMLRNVIAGLSCEPEGIYISAGTLESERVVFEEGDQSLEIIGTPDMVLEVVGKTSVDKDTVTLKELYAKAGIAEYWLVDSTMETSDLVIMRLVAGKYVISRKHDGWVKSHVFGRSFRLTCRKDAMGLSQFNLETK